MERTKGKQVRVMTNGDVRQYDYKTIIVDGGLHHQLKEKGREVNLSINKYIAFLLSLHHPNVEIKNIDAHVIKKADENTHNP